MGVRRERKKGRTFSKMNTYTRDNITLMGEAGTKIKKVYRRRAARQQISIGTFCKRNFESKRGDKFNKKNEKARRKRDSKRKPSNRKKGSILEIWMPNEEEERRKVQAEKRALRKSK